VDADELSVVAQCTVYNKLIIRFVDVYNKLIIRFVDVYNTLIIRFVDVYNTLIIRFVDADELSVVAQDVQDLAQRLGLEEVILSFNFFFLEVLRFGRTRSRPAARAGRGNPFFLIIFLEVLFFVVRL
jgi:hypothetical protein